MRIIDILTESSTPNPVAKAAQKVAKGSGQHKNPKRALEVPRKEKHKKSIPVAEAGKTAREKWTAASNAREKAHQEREAEIAKLPQEKRSGAAIDALANHLDKVKEQHSDVMKKIFKDKLGKPVGEIGIDPEASPGGGNWYVKHYASGYDVVGFDNATEAKKELMYAHKHADVLGEMFLDEHGKASRALCLSSRSDSDLGASQLASCKSQGLRARDGKKSHKLGKSPNSRITVGGHKIKGAKYGGKLPDWS